ncbi:MAG: condensation domain-containing protein, partial [Ferruginibacter sp.]
KLQLKVPENKKIDKSLLDEIKNNKKSIIDFLSNGNWKVKNVDKDHNRVPRFNRIETPQIPLSFSQERLWFIDQLEGSLQYHSPIVLRLKGKLHIQALANSLQSIVQRHEVLRTIFREQNGIVFQQVKADETNWELNIIDDLFYKKPGAGLHEFVEELIRKPFNLSEDFMLRGALLVLDEQDYLLVITMHHIASDAWSLNIIIKEVVSLYDSYSQELPVQLPPLELQYADYAVWQRNFLQGEIFEQKVQYWKEKLDGVTPLQLPGDFVKPAIRSSRGASIGFSIDKEISDQLHDLSRQQGTTLFITLLSAFNVLLHRYTGQQDICVGTSIGNRPQRELENLVGFFVNTLALRSEVNSDLSFTDLLQQVKITTFGAYSNQEVPFEKVVETVVKERDPSRSPLFQVMLVLHNIPASSQLQLGELNLSAENYEPNTVKFDLTFFITETENGLHGSVRYSTDLYKEETITRMMGHFSNLLSSLVKAPEQKIGLLPMLAVTEQQELLEGFNESSVDYPKEKTIVSLFEEQAGKAPDNAAVVFEKDQLSYRELNERSNQLAHYLVSKGVRAGTLVPVFIDRSTEMLVAIMGILKSGAAYVPIDVDFPHDRISYMLEDTTATIVISSKSSSSHIRELTSSLVD